MRNLLLTSFFTLLVLLLITSVNTSIFAATTGKVQGIVIDAESKDPLPGVNVILEGTIFGAATDENGFYFIINLPPGTYQLKTSMVGYSTETISDVRIYVDRTTTQDISLRSSAIIGEEVTVTASRVPVPLDVSATEVYVAGEEVVESAVGRFDELMGMQAGIELGNKEPRQRARGFEVRGGEVVETDLHIDGMSTQNKMTTGSITTISRNLIQDVQILTGGFNAEYGNIRSGLINVITKDGSYNRYSGVVEGRVSPKDWKHFGMHRFDQDTENGFDYAVVHWSEATRYAGVSSDMTYDHRSKPNNNKNYFKVWEGFDSYAVKQQKAGFPYSKEFYYGLSRWLMRPIPFVESDDVMLDVVGGGPVPGLSNTKFFASAFWNRSEYVNFATRPRSHEHNFSMKLTRRLRANMVLTASAFYTQANGMDVGGTSPYWSSTGMSDDMGRDAQSANIILGDDKLGYARTSIGGNSTSYLIQQSGNSNQNDRTQAYNLKFTHTVSPQTYYEINASAYLFDSDRYRIGSTDLETVVHWIPDMDGTGRDIGINEYPRGWSPRGVFITPQEDIPVTIAKRTIIGYYTREGGKNKHDNVMGDYQVRGSLVSQVNKYNQIKAGFYVSRSYIRQNYSFPGTSRREVYIEKKPSEFDFFKARPWQLDIYIQDKLEWEGMIVNAGLRTMTWFPRTNGFDLTPENMYGYDEEGFAYWRWQDQWGQAGRNPKYIVDDGNWMYKDMQTRKVKHRIILQPRLGISHPITESSKIFFNYGHFYNQPRAAFMLGVNAVQASTKRGGGNSQIPTPDLRWPKVIQYEIGYSQSIYNQILLQLSGYYKDYSDETTVLNFNSYYGDNVARTYMNFGYKDIRGIEFRLERSFGRFLNGWANYNYMIKSWGMTGFRELYEDPLKMEDQYQTQSQDKPQTRPTFRINFSFRTPVGWGPGSPLPLLEIKPLAEWRVNLLYTWREGGESLWNASQAPKEWFYVDYKNQMMSSLYISKRLARGLQFYAQITNLFNNVRLKRQDNRYRDTLNLWFETGSGYDQKGNDKLGDYKMDYVVLPSQGWGNFWPERRDAYFGLRYQF